MDTEFYKVIYTEPNNERTMFFFNSFILCNCLPKFKLQLYVISVQVPNRFVHDFVAERFILSRAHTNDIFASARESRVLVMEKNALLF